MLARMLRKRNPHTLLVGMQASAFTLENSMEAPYNLNIDLLYNPPIPLLRIYPKECVSGYSRCICTPMFIVLFTIAKLWKQPRCPTTDECIKVMWYLYTTEFYSAMKKNEILLFTSKWMELENIILSKANQAQETKSHMLSCSPAYADFRSSANAVMLLDLGHMLRGEHIWEEWG
jgi:hypothetical protein